MAYRQSIQRLDRLDLLRGVSILLVILMHTGIFLPFYGLAPGKRLPVVVYQTIFANGHYGVWIFFAISGFLITLTSIRRFGSLRQLTPAAFYKIRFARIAPTLLAVLAVLSVLQLAHARIYEFGPEFGSLGNVLFAALTFQINWLQSLHGWLPLCWLGLWSLSVEEMFYLFFPLACALLRRRWSAPIFVALLLLLLRLGPLSRWPASHANDRWLYMSYLGNMDMIVIGCIFALLANRLSHHQSERTTPWIHMLGLVGFAGLIFTAISSWLVAVPSWARPATVLLEHMRLFLVNRGLHQDAVAVATGLLMTAGVLRALPGSRWTFPLRWLGRRSYEIYLTHMFVINTLNPYTLPWHLSLPLWLATVIGLSAALGYLVARFLSEPANRLLRGAPLPFQLGRRGKS